MAANLADGPCDVLVIGGGPAGSTVAALLAQRGERVVLVEKDRHPRFHIGESLLPLNLPMFEELGIAEDIRRIGMPKYSADFVSPYHNKTMSFDFADAWDKNFPYAYHVRRSEFDHVLLKNAAAKGATVIESCRITEVKFMPDGGVSAEGRDEHGDTRRWQARFLIDASGRDTLLANRFGFKRRNRKHNSAAMFGHFKGARRGIGKAEGNIAIFWFDHGWFWLIPLLDGTTSIGAVCWPQYIKSRKGDLTRFFMETIAQCPALMERLEGAELVSTVTGTGNYSYRSDRMIGRNYILLGDAFAFVDPVFSTGVFLAMKSAFLGADAVSIALHQPRQAARALRRFDAEIRSGLDAVSWYIYRITTPAMRNILMTPRNVWRVQEALLSLLAGDFFRPQIRQRLVIFKLIYYVSSLRQLKDSLRAWRKHKRDIRIPAGDAA